MINIAQALKQFIIAFFTSFFTKWVEDFLILVGIGLIVVNTYLITVVGMNVLAGNYLLGVIFIFIGVVLAKQR